MPTLSLPPRRSPGLDLLPVECALDEVGLIASGLSPDQAEALAKCAAWTTTYPLKRVQKRRRFFPDSHEPVELDP